MTGSLLLATAGLAAAIFATATGALKADDGVKAVPPVLRFTMKTLAGQDKALSDYSGKVVLMVNTASKCGFTPQYKQLEAVHKQYAEKGLAVIGFPANNFGGQEPGSDEEIATFCEKNFGVTFDLFSKISVKGDDQHPLYQFLTGKETDPQFAGPIKWNFEKFLIGRDGKIIARFDSKIKPDSKELTEAVEKALAAK